MTRPVFRTGPGEALHLVEQWIRTPALRELVEADGGTWPVGSTVEVVRQLEAFSTIWDKRNGQSRLTFKEDTESRIDERARRIYQAARELGLIDSSPPTLSKVDHLLILGGLATGVEPRVRFAAQLIFSGTISAGSVAVLGSFRVLGQREQEAATHYSPAAQFEIDLLSAMVAEVFDHRVTSLVRAVGDPHADPATAERICRFDGAPPVIAYASASSQPTVRPANTADTYRQFATHENLRSFQSVLAITSTIYRPFQHMDAVRILSPYGATVETIGVQSTSDSPAHSPSAYLQEVRSAIRSAATLLASAQIT